MVTIGICSKCGKNGVVQQHHYKGYVTDDTIPYCRSCDSLAHRKARNEGRCLLTYTEMRKASMKSSNKEIMKRSIFTYSPDQYVQIYTRLFYNNRTGTITVCTSHKIHKQYNK